MVWEKNIVILSETIQDVSAKVLLPPRHTHTHKYTRSISAHFEPDLWDLIINFWLTFSPDGSGGTEIMQI